MYKYFELKAIKYKLYNNMRLRSSTGGKYGEQVRYKQGERI